MDSLYKRFDIESPIGKFLLAVNNDDMSNSFVSATSIYPNYIPVFSNFIATKESKDILKPYTETQIISEGVNFGNVNLPFIYDKNDIFAIFDAYTIQDETSPRSVINFNYFYNPTITNFMKMCRIKQYILNGYIVFANKFVFINDTIADMLRRIRYVNGKTDTAIQMQMDILVNDIIPIVDTITDAEELQNILTYYGTELYDQDCGDDAKIEVVISETTGDTDNESKLGNRTNYIERERRGVNMSRRGGTIYEESDDSDYSEYSEYSEDIDDSESVSESDIDSDDSYDYEWTFEIVGKPFEDSLRLQALWSIAQNPSLRRRLMLSKEFKTWKKDQNVDMTDSEFLVSLLRAQTPLNTEDVEGIIFFDKLDGVAFAGLRNEYPKNTDDILTNFNYDYGNVIVWDDMQSFESAYPEVYKWIKQVLKI